MPLEHEGSRAAHRAEPANYCSAPLFFCPLTGFVLDASHLPKEQSEKAV